MSMIHRSCTLDGRSSSLIRGMARLRTVRSIAYTNAASVRTPRPIHSRRVARAGTACSLIGGHQLPLDRLAVPVVMVDEHALDGLGQALASGAGRSRHEIELGIG